MTLPYSEKVDLTKLIPVIQVSLGATINPKSGDVVDFTNPVNYLVTAEDKSQAVYKVTVIKENRMSRYPKLSLKVSKSKNLYCMS